MESKVKNLQLQLANTSDQLNRRTQTTSREREMLAQTLERLSQSESTIQQLQQNLTKSHAQNKQFANTHALLMDKLVEMEQASPSQPPRIIADSKQQITQLETALQDSRIKLAQRDKDFEDVITKMNRILERLHTNPAVRTP